LCFDGYIDWLQEVENTGLAVLRELVVQEQEAWIEKHKREMDVWRAQAAEWGESGSVFHDSMLNAY
jgi:hypothetical protein